MSSPIDAPGARDSEPGPRVDERPGRLDTRGRADRTTWLGRTGGGEVSASLAPPRSTGQPEDEQSVASGRRVILAEAEALRVLAETVDGAFSRAVAMLASVGGRVV